MLKIKKGDTVMVRRGSHKGKSGKVTEVLPKLNQVIVEGVNEAIKHRKPTQKSPKGGIEKLARPIDVAKVGIVHPSKKGQTSRIGYTTDKSGKKLRVYRQAGNKEIKS